MAPSEKEFDTTDLEGVMLNKSGKERQVPHDFTYMWNLKNKINEQAKQKQTLRYREQTDGGQIGDGLGEGVKKVKGLRSTNWQCK